MKITSLWYYSTCMFGLLCMHIVIIIYPFKIKAMWFTYVYLYASVLVMRKYGGISNLSSCLKAVYVTE